MNEYYKHFDVNICCCRQTYENLIELYSAYYWLSNSPAKLNSVLAEYAYYTNY